MVLPASVAEAQSKSSKKTTSAKKSSSKKVTGPENSLVGIRIYDDALRVLSMYGNPDTITSVSVGSTSSTGDGGGGGRGGFGGPPSTGPGGGSGAPRGGGSGAPMKPSSDSVTDFIPGSFLDGPVGNFQGVPKGGGGPRGGPSGPPPGVGGPPRGGGGAGSMDSGMPPGAPGGGGAPGASSNETAEFTRWTYTRNGTKLGFVVDKFNRVVQIEAIGLQNAQVRTKRGVGFGSSFTNVMNAYAPSQEPDGYDLNGDNFTIRFLTRTRVAFRLTRLSTKKSHVVTGIVVAAGKK
jgi:hypothetical protein